MIWRPRRLVLTLALAALVPLVGPAASMQQASQKRAIELEDIIKWKSLGSPAVSNDGQWFAYRLGPGEGDAQIVVRSTQSDKEMKFDIGEPGTGGAGGGGGGAAFTGGATLGFSDDSKYIAFTTYPTQAEARRLRRQRRPLQNGVTIVNLATEEKHSVPKIRQFAFSGEAAGWIALARYPPQAPQGARAGTTPAGGRGDRGPDSP
jgi:hypothetical protein